MLLMGLDTEMAIVVAYGSIRNCDKVDKSGPMWYISLFATILATVLLTRLTALMTDWC